MPTENEHREQELRIQRQIAFASGLFQGDVTIRTLLESLSEGVVIIDSSGTILLVNTHAEQMFGYPKNELIGKPHAMLIPEHLRKVHEEHEAGYFKEPKVRPMGQLLDLTGRRRDGSEFPVEISLGFIETVNGVLAMAFVSDITLRKQYESRLRESEELFHVQIERVKNYAIFTLDTQGNVLNWNPGAERLKGYRAEEIIGKHFSCFYTEEERHSGRAEGVLKKAVAVGQFEDEGWRIRKDGSRFWADMIITTLHDEHRNLRGFSNVTRDITERKKVQDALRFSEERYRALFRDNPVMIITLDADLTMLSVNPTCASLLGYTTDELEGRAVLEIFHEDDRPAVTEQMRLCLQNPGQVYRWQFRKIRKDGSLVWAEETAQAVYDLNGALNVLVVCQDITERKEAEEALRESEVHYRTLFDSIDEGFCIIEMIFDENDRPVDYRFLETSPSFEKQTGLIAARGKRMRELAPKHEEHWFETYGRIALTGEPARFENRAEQLRRWYDVYAFRFGQPEKRQVGIIFNDISERKQTEEALRLEKNFTDTVINSMPGIFYVFDDQKQLIRWNRRLEEFSGRSPEAMPALRPHDFVAEENHGLLESKLGEVFDEHRNADVELLLLDREGRKIPFYCTGSPMTDDERTYLIGLGIDISERKRAEEAQRESEQRFASFMLHLPAAAWMKDLHGRYVYANAEAERIFPTQLPVLDKTDGEVFPPETARQFRENDARVLAEGGSLQTTEVLRQADGIDHQSIVSKFAVPGPDGQPTYVAGVALDVTDLKHAEEALRKSELKLSKIFHTVPALIGITTVAEGRCIDINETGLRTLGYRREEIVGKTTLELGVWESKSARDRVIRVLEENGTVRDMEINFRSRDGKTFTGLFSAELVDFNGDQYMLSIVNDITERKRMEEEIERLNTDLAARAAELEAANRELEAFNYSVAHDLRNPLNVISSYCQAIEMLCGDKLDEQCNGYLRETYNGALRMDRLIGVLLNFSRLAHVEPHRELVDLGALANEVVSMLKLTKPERQVDFRIAEGITANVDANLLRVVLDNLLGNAWKFTSMREQPVIEFGALEVDGQWTYFVRDNGNGFDMADAEKLFVPFHRLPGAEEFRGFGIGLAAVERIIRRHGGRIWAEGEPGSGATFRFTLPS